MSETSNVQITADPEHDRYLLSIDGEKAGKTNYISVDGRRVFVHTEIADKFEGHGYASKLVTFALDDTRAAGLRVIAVCPYVTSYLQRHTEYADIVDTDPEMLNALGL